MRLLKHYNNQISIDEFDNSPTLLEDLNVGDYALLNYSLDSFIIKVIPSGEGIRLVEIDSKIPIQIHRGMQVYKKKINLIVRKL